MSKYLTVAEIAEQAELPNSTCRRYLTTFEAFFVIKGGSRLKKYEAAAVNILKRIKQLYDEGQDTQEINNVLIHEFPMVVNDGEQQRADEQVPALATSEDIEEIKAALEEQKQFNKMLLQKLEEQNDFFKKALKKKDNDLLALLEHTQQLKNEAVSPVQQKPGFFTRLFNK